MTDALARRRAFRVRYAFNHQEAQSGGLTALRDRDSWAIMPKMRHKADFPEKVCAACGRPFSWRKKWAKVWDEVKTCSDRCKGDLRRKRPETAQS